jgi:hypothetical protein
MPNNPEAIQAAIEQPATPRFRGRLITRGQSGAMIWRDEALPADAPAFSPRLSYDLKAYAYALFEQGLCMRDLNGDPVVARLAFEQAASALESVIAKGDRAEVERDFHFVMAASAYHLAHLAARAYSLLAIVGADENFSPIERALSDLMRRDFSRLNDTIIAFKASSIATDAQIAANINAAIEAPAVPDGRGCGAGERAADQRQRGASP